jgi:hypothetical protein
MKKYSKFFIELLCLNLLSSLQHTTSNFTLMLPEVTLYTICQLPFLDVAHDQVV